MKSFWDERFSASEYIYGKKPNTFFAEQLAQLKPGKLLLPCEGEGGARHTGIGGARGGIG